MDTSVNTNNVGTFITGSFGSRVSGRIDFYRNSKVYHIYSGVYDFIVCAPGTDGAASKILAQFGFPASDYDIVDSYDGNYYVLKLKDNRLYVHIGNYDSQKPTVSYLCSQYCNSYFRCGEEGYYRCDSKGNILT